MTAPVQPNVIQREGVGETVQRVFQPMMQAIAMNREFKQREKDFQLRQQQFQLEQFKTQKGAELTDQQIAEGKARIANLKLENEQAQRDFAGEQAGQQAVNLLATEAQTTDAEFGTPEWNALVRNARASLSNLGDDADPGAAHAHFDAYLDQVREDATGAANIKANEARIAQAQAQTALAEAQAAAARQEAERDARASVLELGQDVPLPLGVIGSQIRAPVDRSIAGVVLPSALGQSTGGKESEQVLRARTFNTVMTPEAARIKGLLASGTRIGFVGSLNALISGQQGFFSTTARILSNKFIPEDQRQYLASTRNYVAAWQYFSSGAQINEGEYFRLYQGVIPTRGDDEGTIAVKLSIIDTQLQAIREIANGSFGGGPADGAIAALEKLQQRGFAEKWKAPIQRSIAAQLEQARSWRATLQRSPDSFVYSPPQMIDQDGNISNFENSAEAQQRRIQGFSNLYDSFQNPSQLQLPN